MKRLCAALGVAALLGLSSETEAAVNWDWSFTQGTVNLAQSTSVFVTLTNLDTSDEAIGRAYIDVMSFGTFGILVDPSNGAQVTPWAKHLDGSLAPGRSVTFEALRFYFSGDPSRDWPSAAFSQTITPSLKVFGSSCESLDCATVKASETPLTLIYSAVPEVMSWSLWIAGLSCLVAFRGRRRAS